MKISQKKGLGKHLVGRKKLCYFAAIFVKLKLFVKFFSCEKKLVSSISVPNSESELLH